MRGGRALGLLAGFRNEVRVVLTVARSRAPVYSWVNVTLG
jgi:hypothetical protein